MVLQMVSNETFAILAPQVYDGYLRPHQVDGCEQVLTDFAAGYMRTLLVSPTGSGKTEIAIRLIQLFRSAGLRVAFIVHRKRIVQQTSERFYRAGLHHGMIQADNTRDTYLPVLVCSIDTVARRGMPMVDVMIFDEAHDMPGSAAYINLVANEKNHCVGLTATPYTNGMIKNVPGVGPLFEKAYRVATLRELIDAGYAPEYEMYSGKLVPKLEAIKIVRGDYDPAQAELVMNQTHLVGDIVETWLEKGGGEKTLLFAQSVAHSRALCQAFKDAGVRAEHIDCYLDDEEQAKIFVRLQAGEITVLCNFGILTTGYDFPALRNLILARATKNLNLYLQMTGRVFRLDGSAIKKIFDHGENWVKHGAPCNDFGMELDDGTKKDKDKSEPKEKPPIKESKCPCCQYIKPRGERKCGMCGFEPIPDAGIFHQKAELKLVTKGEQKPKKQTSIQVLGERDDTLLFSQLIGHVTNENESRLLDGRKPMSMGWAYHKFEEIKGKKWAGKLPEKSDPDDTLSRWIRSEFIKWAKSRKAA